MQRSEQFNVNNNSVVVRIWPSMFSSSYPDTWKSPGHVSIQTFRGGADGQGYYISYWPASSDAPCPCKNCKAKQDHFHTLDDDTRDRGQVTLDNTFELHTLDIDLINQHFETRKATGLRWSLRGSMFTFRDDSVANCASLAHDCLVSGGLNNLVSRWDRTFLGLKEAFANKVYFTVMAVAIPVSIATAYYLVKHPPVDTKYIINMVRGALSKRRSHRLPRKLLDNLSSLLDQQNANTPLLSLAYIRGLISMLTRYGVTTTSAVITTGAGVITTCAQGISSVTSNLMSFKPSDMKRIMPTARDNDIKRSAMFFATPAAEQNTPQQNEVASSYRSNWCAIL